MAAGGPLDVPGSYPHYNLITLASYAIALEAALMGLSSALVIVCFFSFHFPPFLPFFFSIRTLVTFSPLFGIS